MRSSALIVLALAGSLTACGAQNKGACSPVSSWSAPVVQCGGASAAAASASAPEVAVATKPSPEPEPEVVKPGKPEPEPEPEKPPPPPPPKAELKRDRIDVQETVEFEADSAVLTDGSKQVLNDIASMLADHPEIKKVTIEDRAETTVPKKRQAKLSQERANAVKTYLVSKGVAGKRLATKGLGAAKGKTAQVNFKITQRGK